MDVVGLLEHVALREKPVPVARRHDHDGVGGDATVLGTARLEAEPPLEIDELDRVTVRVDPVHVEVRRRGAVGREELPQAALDRVGFARDRPQVDPIASLIEAVERLERRGAQRPATVARPVPAGEVASAEDVHHGGEDHGGEQPQELEHLRAIETEGASAHPHLHESTARVATKSESTIVVP